MKKKKYLSCLFWNITLLIVMFSAVLGFSGFSSFNLSVFTCFLQGSLQRSQYVMEYLDEAKGTILKMLDHKTKVAGIVKKHANKRHVKKKHSP